MAKKLFEELWIHGGDRVVWGGVGGLVLGAGAAGALVYAAEQLRPALQLTRAGHRVKRGWQVIWLFILPLVAGAVGTLWGLAQASTQLIEGHVALSARTAVHGLWALKAVPGAGHVVRWLGERPVDPAEVEHLIVQRPNQLARALLGDDPQAFGDGAAGRAARAALGHLRPHLPSWIEGGLVAVAQLPMEERRALVRPSLRPLGERAVHVHGARGQPTLEDVVNALTAPDLFARAAAQVRAYLLAPGWLLLLFALGLVATGGGHLWWLGRRSTRDAGGPPGRAEAERVHASLKRPPEPDDAT